MTLMKTHDERQQFVLDAMTSDRDEIRSAFMACLLKCAAELADMAFDAALTPSAVPSGHATGLEQRPKGKVIPLHR